MTDERFEQERRDEIRLMGRDEAFKKLSLAWMAQSVPHRYSYHFNWLGVPIIQYPTDIVAMQEIVWSVKPDLIVETGIARGGSLIFWSSMMQLMGGEGRVLGIDIDIRPHTREAIAAHPLASRISMIEGSSVDPETVRKATEFARPFGQVLVVLDSNHAHDHVWRELHAYSPLVRPGGYLIVFDTIVEELPEGLITGRPWSQGNSPMTAVKEFLNENRRFVLDEEMDAKLGITVAPRGFLKCVR